jgi:hypothetical protein
LATVPEFLTNQDHPVSITRFKRLGLGLDTNPDPDDGKIYPKVGLFWWEIDDEQIGE